MPTWTSTVPIHQYLGMDKATVENVPAMLEAIHEDDSSDGGGESGEANENLDGSSHRDRPGGATCHQRDTRPGDAVGERDARSGGAAASQQSPPPRHKRV